MSRACFIGVDIGTQGARVVAVDEQGRQLAAKSEVFELTDLSRQEQDPEMWWACCSRLLGQLCRELSLLANAIEVKAIGVTSTSGTIIPVDKNNKPLHPAIMYSDGRSAKEAGICRQAATEAGGAGYTAFNASSGLPKMLWFLNNYPGKAAALGRFIHAADFITGRLSGNFEVTDYTNALKSGYDLHRLCWPGYISAGLGVGSEWLQQVVPSGTPLGVLKREWALAWGLPEDVWITAGITDGCASQVASGAVCVGDWNTTIGTTLVIKGVTRNEIKDPDGAIYCHRHPEGYWMPGGASNTGADWVSRLFGDMDIQQLSLAAGSLIPGKHLAWPLMQKGERFPFVAPGAEGFIPGGLTKEEQFVANMEGVAYIERYAFERISHISGENITQVFSAGGGSNSDLWLRIRSSVMGIPVSKMQYVSGATGAAIIAASKTFFEHVMQAARQMIHSHSVVDPEAQLQEQYEHRYCSFIKMLKEKGYIHE